MADLAEDLRQLGHVAALGGGTASERVPRLQGAVERLNAAAKNLRTIVADVAWEGEAAEAARGAFQALAATLNEHADAINAIAAADGSTDAPIATAANEYHVIADLREQEGSVYYDQAGRSFDQYRADLASEARSRLFWSMSDATRAVQAAASWDLEVPPAGNAPGGADPGGGGVTGTVPPGATPVPGTGGVDPVGPVTGTVPPGATSPDDGGFDPVGPVTGTVPPGATSPNGGGFDPVGPVTGTTNLLTNAAPSVRDIPAELRRRLG